MEHNGSTAVGDIKCLSVAKTTVIQCLRKYTCYTLRVFDAWCLTSDNNQLYSNAVHHPVTSSALKKHHYKSRGKSSNGTWALVLFDL